MAERIIKPDAGAGNKLTLQDEGGTDSLTVDDGAQVGIKTDSPSSLHSNANQLVVGSGSGHQGVTIYAGTGSSSIIYFADGTTGTDRYDGWIEYLHNQQAVSFGTGASERLSISSAGNVTFHDGNLVIGTAGKGIDFSEAQTPAAGMTAEILDSYEEGTFGGTGANESIQPSTSGTVTCGSSELYYTKIGRTVTIAGWVRTTAESSASGNLRLNLPFTCQMIGAGSFTCWDQNLSSGFGTSLYFLTPVAFCYPWTASDDGSAVYITYDANAYLYFGATYLVA